jgi:hypothetical protein
MKIVALFGCLAAILLSPVAVSADELVLVYEDAWLHAQPSDESARFRIGQPLRPRAVRPYRLIRRGTEWVTLQTFTTEDVGRILPCPVLSNLKIQLHVRPADVARTVRPNELPKKLSPAIEYRFDTCRNVAAHVAVAAVARGEVPAVTELPIARRIEDPFGRQVAANAKLWWPGGKHRAGIARHALPLMSPSEQEPNLTCFELDVGTGAGTWGPSRERRLTLCVNSESILRR